MNRDAASHAAIPGKCCRRRHRLFSTAIEAALAEFTAVTAAAAAFLFWTLIRFITCAGSKYTCKREDGQVVYDGGGRVKEKERQDGNIL